MSIEEAKEILGKLDESHNYFNRLPGDETVILDGWFTADELEALALWMRVGFNW